MYAYYKIAFHLNQMLDGALRIPRITFCQQNNTRGFLANIFAWKFNLAWSVQWKFDLSRSAKQSRSKHSFANVISPLIQFYYLTWNLHKRSGSLESWFGWSFESQIAIWFWSFINDENPRWNLLDLWWRLDAKIIKAQLVLNDFEISLMMLLPLFSITRCIDHAINISCVYFKSISFLFMW
jgi:hypothetical protein